MPRPRLTAVLVSTALVVLVSGGPARAQAASTPPFTTPDTAACPYASTPGPAVDASEAPAPGASAPEPLPVPDPPVGGDALGGCGLISPAGAPAPPEGISAASWVVADLDTGQVLAAKDPHARHRPASTLKLLTTQLVLRTLPLDQVVTGTQADADAEGSAVGVGPGGTYSVETLLTGLLLKSGNDAAHALAAAMGGVPETVSAMNELATTLGALDTRAVTPSGLDGPGQVTSAYDLALLFRADLADPTFTSLVGTVRSTFPGYGGRPGFEIDNDVSLLTTYPGAIGGKPGFTDDARHTYVAAARRDGRRLVVTLMNGERQPLTISEQAAALLDWGFARPAGSGVGELVSGPPAAPARGAASTPTERGTSAGTVPSLVAVQQEGRSASRLLGLATLALGATLVVVLVAVVLDARRRRPRR